MAILKFGTLITAARGTIGGVTLSANKAGPYAKPWARGPRQLTPRQAITRGAFGAFKFHWQALSAGQRADWNTFAADPGQAQTNALGETYYLSGWQWFAKINGWRIQPYDLSAIGAPVIAPAIITAPPVAGPAAAPTLTALEAHYTPPASITLAFSSAAPGPDEYITLEARVIFSPSQLYTPPAFLALYALQDGDTSPATLSDPVIDAFGGLPAGAQFALRAHFLPADGYRSAAAELVANTEA